MEDNIKKKSKLVRSATKANSLKESIYAPPTERSLPPGSG
jgi:hypothetical protein